MSGDARRGGVREPPADWRPWVRRAWRWHLLGILMFALTPASLLLGAAIGARKGFAEAWDELCAEWRQVW